ncbi:LysR family transcriptional regulator [Phormidium tenue FACHB-886]|nr:LysR family transcriptional regulator [Phormidium tenue FACHB-886]
MNRQMLGQLDFSALISFIEVAERNSFTDAANVLNLSQPTVSQHIQRVERILGVQLLHRKSNGVYLTEEGKVFIQYCRGCLQGLQEGANAVAKMSQDISGIVTLGLTPSSSQRFLSNVLSQYHRQYPQVQVKVLEDYTDGLISQVEQGLIDVAILSMPFPQENVTCEILYQEPVILVIGATHPLAAQKQLCLNEIETLPLVLHRQKSTFGSSPCGIGTIVEKIYQTYSHRFKIVAEVKGFQSVRQLVLSNFGATFAPYSLVQEDLENGRLISIEIPECSFSRSAVLITNQRHCLSVAAEKMVEAVRIRANQLLLSAVVVG